MWYSKYLQAFEKPCESVSDSIKQEIANKIKIFNNNDNPLCSIVAIAHNEERHILGCLWSIVDNICNFPIEIIVVNNNSSDSTESLLKAIGVKYFNESRQSPGYARQCGLDNAHGKYHMCIDADTLYPPHYIETHVKYLSMGYICTYSLWSFLPDKKHSRLNLKLYESFRDLYLLLQNINRPELVVRGMTLSFVANEGKKVKYRTHIIRGEDGMMALGLKKKGKLKMIISRKNRAITSNTTLNKNGSLARNALLRIKKALKNFKLLFTSQSEYKDRDDNIIDKNKNNT